MPTQTLRFRVQAKYADGCGAKTTLADVPLYETLAYGGDLVADTDALAEAVYFLAINPHTKDTVTVDLLTDIPGVSAIVDIAPTPPPLRTAAPIPVEAEDAPDVPPSPFSVSADSFEGVGGRALPLGWESTSSAHDLDDTEYPRESAHESYLVEQYEREARGIAV